jgi:hypothetical protein
MSGGPEVSLNCPSCGASVLRDQQFCTSCGARIPSDVSRPLQSARPPEASTVPLSAPRRGLSTKWKVALGLLALAFIGLVIGNIHQQRQLAAANDTIAVLEDDKADLERGLAFTTAKLESTEALSTRRKTVLEQAKTVVKQVDPVLSSADTLQELTSKMQEQQTSFADNSDSVISYLATMVDYLASTDALYWDISYVQSVLDNAVTYYDASRADSNQLGALSSRYDSASRRFETKATGYTQAVERLQKRLVRATR